MSCCVLGLCDDGLQDSRQRCLEDVGSPLEGWKSDSIDSFSVQDLLTEAVGLLIR